MIRKRILAAAFLAAIVASGAAQAGYVDTPDSNRCDTWYRSGNAADGTKYDDNNNGTTKDDGPATTISGNNQIVNESGHYVVRGDWGYVEVVGGADYRRPLGDTTNGARGGYVQGEIETGPADDMDFHASTFPGTDGTSVGRVEKNLCVNYGETRYVNAFDCKAPPKQGDTRICPQS